MPQFRDWEVKLGQRISCQSKTMDMERSICLPWFGHPNPQQDGQRSLKKEEEDGHCIDRYRMIQKISQIGRE